VSTTVIPSLTTTTAKLRETSAAAGEEARSGLLDDAAAYGKFPFNSSIDSNKRPCNVCFAKYKP
jgi:hypothetical protein